MNMCHVVTANVQHPAFAHSIRNALHAHLIPCSCDNTCTPSTVFAAASQHENGQHNCKAYACITTSTHYMTFVSLSLLDTAKCVELGPIRPTCFKNICT